MDVFIGYTPEDEFAILKATMEAWNECDGANVKAIFVEKKSRFELSRRIAADNLSEEKFYILADLGCVPASLDLVRVARAKINDDFALVGLVPLDSEASEVPNGVRICQKQAISHWIPKETADYAMEHMKSAKRTGKKVEIWPDVNFKHLGAS